MLTNKWQKLDVCMVEVKPGENVKMIKSFVQWVILDTGNELIHVRMQVYDRAFGKGEDFNLDKYEAGQMYQWNVREHKVWGYEGYPASPAMEVRLKPEAPRGKDVHRAAQRKEHEHGMDSI